MAARREVGEWVASCELGRVLQELMAARGWSQVRLGRESGVDHSAVSRLMRCERRPSVGMLVRFGLALGLDDADLATLAWAALVDARQAVAGEMGGE